MLSIDNPSKSNIYRFTKTDQKFSIYEKRNTESFVPWFHVDNYYGKNNKKKSQRSYKSFKSRVDAITWATRICELLPKKFVGQHEKIEDIVKYGKTFTRKEALQLCLEAMLRLKDYPFITSNTVLIEAGLDTPDKRYNDKVYRACSTIRLYNDKFGIKTVDLGRPHPDFSRGKRRPAQIFKVEGKL
tara:strand:- start:194 stop:751 length:558 start_codon:yes stop_codon:yes gene_type:complete